MAPIPCQTPDVELTQKTLQTDTWRFSPRYDTQDAQANHAACLGAAVTGARCWVGAAQPKTPADSKGVLRRSACRRDHLKAASIRSSPAAFHSQAGPASPRHLWPGPGLRGLCTAALLAHAPRPAPQHLPGGALGRARSPALSLEPGPAVTPLKERARSGLSEGRRSSGLCRCPKVQGAGLGRGKWGPGDVGEKRAPVTAPRLTAGAQPHSGFAAGCFRFSP